SKGGDTGNVEAETTGAATDTAILWPPPPVQVSATPAAAAQEKLAAEATAEAPEKVAFMGGAGAKIGLALVVTLGVLVILASPASVSANYMVLTLAIVLGFYVISSVTPRLHTPLMSETNAISGIV